tara:strand:- start:1414 stop:1602 length:189 start_codon:yes stop_codon:yes gene_type:complete
MFELSKNILRYRFFGLTVISALLFYYEYRTIASFVFISSILDLSIVQELANNKKTDAVDEEE